MGEVRRRQDGSAIPRFYRPLAPSPRPAMTLVAGVEGDPEAWSESVRAATWAMDPDQPVEAVVSLRTAEFRDPARPRSLPRTVRAMVMRQGVGVAAVGALVGLGGAWLAAGLMGSMMMGVSPGIR